jgi:hypothetical protein
MFECADVVGPKACQQMLQHVLEQSSALAQLALKFHHGKELIHNLQITSVQQGMESIHPDSSNQPSFCRQVLHG